MKMLHDPMFYGWSVFDEARNLDFHSVVWVRSQGNVVIDPVPMSAHDEAHLTALGGAAFVIVTNSDHVRDARRVAALFDAPIAGPRGERAAFPLDCDEWIGAGDQIVSDLRVLELEGSKTPGELALIIQDNTLVTGDLVRGHRGGRLNLLPEARLPDPPAARASVRRLTEEAAIEAVLVGDGWPVFRDGGRALQELVATFP